MDHKTSCVLRTSSLLPQTVSANPLSAAWQQQGPLTICKIGEFYYWALRSFFLQIWQCYPRSVLSGVKMKAAHCWECHQPQDCTQTLEVCMKDKNKGLQWSLGKGCTELRDVIFRHLHRGSNSEETGDRKGDQQAEPWAAQGTVNHKAEYLSLLIYWLHVHRP